MKKYEVLRAVVILQAVCMVVLTVVVVVKVWPGSESPPDQPPPANIGSKRDPKLPSAPDQTPSGPSSEPSDDQRTAATVGADRITVEQLEKQLYKQYGEEVLRMLMVHKAIDLEAAASGLVILPEELNRELKKMTDGYDGETQFFEVMKEQLGMTKEQILEDLRYRLLLEKIAIRKVVVTDAEVDRYIEEHPEEFAPRLQLRLQWILTESEQEANSVLQLLTDGEDFALMARTYSVDSFTADSGGNLGLIDANDPFYDSDMLDTASRLQVAEIAGPIQVDGGYAIIRLVERQTTAAMTGRRLHDAVRKQIALERADSLTETEDKLLAKYEAVKMD